MALNKVNEKQIKLEQEHYSASDSSSSSLISSVIKKGVDIGGITGTLEVLNTSDATATPEDIAKGKTAYVNGVKIVGTREKESDKPKITSVTAEGNSVRILAKSTNSMIVGYAISTSSSTPQTFISRSAVSEMDQMVYGLNYDTLYYVWVKDQNGNISSPASVRTEQEIKTKPSITSLVVNGNSINIQASGGTGEIVGYAVSTSYTTPSYFTTVTATQNLNVTVRGLYYGTFYYVWVKDEDGLISEYSSIRTEAMVTIPALTQYNTTFTPNITYWTNQSVTVRVSTSVYGYTLQTTTSNPNIESSWSNTSSQTLSSNGTIYARLTDGEHTGSYTSYNITNIDTTLPRFLSGGLITISRSNSQSYVHLQLNGISDTDSGIAKIVFYYKRDVDSYFTASDPIDYATINGTETGPKGEFAYGCRAQYYTDITNNTIYMYAKIYDVAGNVINTGLATISPDGHDTSYGDIPYQD